MCSCRRRRLRLSSSSIFARLVVPGRPQSPFVYDIVQHFGMFRSDSMFAFVRACVYVSLRFVLNAEFRSLFGASSSSPSSSSSSSRDVQVDAATKKQKHSIVRLSTMQNETSECSHLHSRRCRARCVICRASHNLSK